MPTQKLIGASIVSDDDPLQVQIRSSVGATSTPKNASVSVTNASTELIAATTASERKTLIINTGDRTVFLAFGEAATTSKFPLQVGQTLTKSSLDAINGITASGTGTVFVLAEARA
jgi:hypothetical protein